MVGLERRLLITGPHDFESGRGTESHGDGNGAIQFDDGRGKSIRVAPGTEMQCAPSLVSAGTVCSAREHAAMAACKVYGPRAPPSFWERSSAAEAARDEKLIPSRAVLIEQ